MAKAFTGTPLLNKLNAAGGSRPAALGSSPPREGEGRKQAGWEKYEEREMSWLASYF